MNGIIAACQGRIAADPVFRFTATGSAMLNFRIAVEGKVRGDGEKEPPQWVQVTAWGETAQQLNDGGKMARGVEVYVEGALRLSEWDTPDGEHRSGLNLSAWTVQLIGAASIGRKSQQPKPERDVADRPRARGGRNGYQGIRSADGYRQPVAAGDW